MLIEFLIRSKTVHSIVFSYVQIIAWNRLLRIKKVEDIECHAIDKIFLKKGKLTHIFKSFHCNKFRVKSLWNFVKVAIFHYFVQLCRCKSAWVVPFVKYICVVFSIRLQVIGYISKKWMCTTPQAFNGLIMCRGDSNMSSCPRMTTSHTTQKLLKSGFEFWASA